MIMMLLHNADLCWLVLVIISQSLKTYTKCTHKLMDFVSARRKKIWSVSSQLSEHLIAFRHLSKFQFDFKFEYFNVYVNVIHKRI